jgi:hypothetical protein
MGSSWWSGLGHLSTLRERHTVSQTQHADRVRISDIRSFLGTPKITSIIPVIVVFLERSNFAAELMRRYSNFSVKERLNRLDLPGER